MSESVTTPSARPQARQKKAVKTGTDKIWQKPQSLFFPAACLHAAIMVPLAMLVMLTGTGPVALVGPGHGAEMLFGFALALVAGYILGPTPRSWLFLIFGAWLLARGWRLSAPEPYTISVLDVLFGVLLAARLLPRLRHAKKWRNRMAVALLGTLCALPALIAILALAFDVSTRLGLTTAVLLFAWLLAYMGGRIIPPQAAGAYKERGLNLDNRVQPRLEALMMVLFCAAVPSLWWQPWLAGVVIAAIGVTIAIRLLRWRLWNCPRTDLVGYAIGYGWLALGLFVLAWNELTSGYRVPGFHAITVGAVGSLSATVIARQRSQSLARIPPSGAWLYPVLGTISLAAVARLYATLAEPVMLYASAASWSLGYLLLCAYILFGGPDPGKRPAR